MIPECRLRGVDFAYIKQSSEAFAVAAAEGSDCDWSRIVGGHGVCAEMKNGEGGWRMGWM